MRKSKLVCENCGMELTAEHVYAEEIQGKIHYFCCKDCADAFKARLS